MKLYHLPYFKSLSRCSLGLFVLAMLWGAGEAFAEPGPDAQRFGPWVWGVAGGAVHQTGSDLQDSDGSVSVSRYFTELSLGYAADRRNSVSLSLGAGESQYDFSSDSFGGLDPWDDVRDYRVSLPIRFAPSDSTSVFIIPSVRSYGEEGTSLNDGRTEGVLAAAGWTLSDKLTLGPGFGWFTELGGGDNFFPILLIDWKITDKLSLSTGRGLAASRGPGFTLDYAASKNWSAGITARYEEIRFALDADGSNPEAYVEDSSVPLLLTAQYSPWPMTSISALAGIEFAGKLKVEDGSGSRLARSDIDNPFVFGLVFSSRF
ncbi:MAG: hypothetical protein AAGF57_13590 [Pseudomonadota bacterium]